MSMISYVFQQVFWLIGVTAQLIASMGIGARWIYMTIRCITFALLDLWYFIPHVVWYMVSPNIIRRVSFRSSQKTKLRNLKMVSARRGSRASGINALEDAEGGITANKDALSSSNFSNALQHGESMDQCQVSTVELLAPTLNPADGSFIRGVPAHVEGDLCLGSTVEPLVASNSFADTFAVWRRYQQRRAQSSAQRQENSPPSAVDAEEEPFTSSDEEDKQNLHNRATLDIYLPVPLDYLFRFMDQSKTPQRGRTKLQRKKFPIVISVNGGAWIVGYYLWNFLVARIFSARGYVVFCPDYRNFPQTTMEGMTLDVSDAIKWVLDNADRYNGDLSNVTLIGQSAGAQLTMMSLISQAQLCAYRANGNGKDGTPAPSDVAYNVPRYNPRKSIHRYVGLSGIYNVRGLLGHFDRRGLYRSVLHQIAGGKAQIPRYTVPYYFDEHHMAETGETLPDNVFEFLPQQMFFLHGEADKSAPVTESANLVYIMRSAQRDFLVKAYRDTPNYAKVGPPPIDIKFILIPGATHTDSIIEEPLACHNSHVVEFLNMYTVNESGIADPAGARSTPGPCDTLDFLSTNEASEPALGKQCTHIVETEDATYPLQPVNRPDGVLIPPIAHNKRRPILRLAALINPF